MTEDPRHEPPVSHPPYERRSAHVDPVGTERLRPYAAPLRAVRHTHRPACRPVLPRRVEVCANCDALRACCQCMASVSDLRRFARRMAELHQHTGTSVCGCGTHRCYVRSRLDDIRHNGTG